MFSGLKVTAVRRVAAESVDLAGGVLAHELGHFTMAALHGLAPSVGLHRNGVHVRHLPGTKQQSQTIAWAGPVAHAATTTMTTRRRHDTTQALLNGALVLMRQLAPVRGADGEHLFGQRYHGFRAALYLTLGVAALGHAVLTTDRVTVAGVACHMDASLPLVCGAASDIYFRIRLERLARGDERL